MVGTPRNRILKDDVLTWLEYALPVPGGLLGVAYVNTDYYEFINPVWAIGGGAILGWILVRLTRKALG